MSRVSSKGSSSTFVLDGWFRQGNFGDAAFLKSWKLVVEGQGLGYEILEDLSAGRDGRRRKILQFPVLLRRAFSGADYVRLGGDLIHEKGDRSIISLAMKVLIFRALGRRTLLLSVGIDGQRVTKSRWALKVLIPASDIVVRDQRSLDFLAEFNPRSIKLLPDIASIHFSELNSLFSDERTETSWVNPYVPKLRDGSKMQNIQRLVDERLRNGAEIIALSTADLPTQLESCSDSLLLSTDDEVTHFINSPGDVLAVRLHLAILCLSLGRRFQVVNYHPKVRAYLDTWALNAPDLVLEPHEQFDGGVVPQTLRTFAPGQLKREYLEVISPGKFPAHGN